MTRTASIADAAIDPEDAAHRPTRWPPTRRSSRRPPPSPNSAPTRASCSALAAVGIERTFAIQALTLPIALGGARPDRPGPHRHGQDPRLRRAAAAAAGPGRQPVAADEKGKLPAGRAPRALVMVPTRELCVQVTRDLHQVGKFLGPGGDLRLRRPRLRAADHRPARRRRPGRRHPRPAAGPGQRRAPGARRDQGAGAGRGRRDARPGLPAGHGAGAGDGARRQADDAVLRDHARPDPHPGPHVHVAADAHPGRGRRRGRDPHPDQAVRLPRARAGQGGDAGPGAAGPRTAA